MIKISQINFIKFFEKIKEKKIFTKTLKKQTILLDRIKKKNYKRLKLEMNSEPYSLKNESLLSYIVTISFLETNTFLHVVNPNGNPIFFCSAGSFKYKGKQKKLRFLIFQSLFKVLVSKLSFLDKKPIALHLNNVDSNKPWILKKLNKRFFIKVIKNYNMYPLNGCRKSKKRRKKF